MLPHHQAGVVGCGNDTKTTVRFMCMLNPRPKMATKLVWLLVTRKLLDLPQIKPISSYSSLIYSSISLLLAGAGDSNPN